MRERKRAPARFFGSLVGLGSVVVLAAAPAGASCYSGLFGQVSPENGYFYVHLPEGADATSDSIIGRYWSPGSRAGSNEGSCDAPHWLLSCDPALWPCGGGVAGRVFYINGSLAGDGCAPAGCVTGEMLTLVQDRSVGQEAAYFAVGRVDETPWLSLAFDDSRIGRDWTLREIPRPAVTGVTRVPGGLILDLAFDDPSDGFFGLDGVPATGTITAFRLFEYRTGSAGHGSPGRETLLWTPAGRFPFEGGRTTGTYEMTLGESGTLFLAAAIELDGGQLVTDYVGRETRLVFPPDPEPPGPGSVPDAGPPLLVAKAGGGDLTLTWRAVTCEYFDLDFEVYEGTIGDFASHRYRTCSTGGAATYTFTPSEGDVYFLAVAFSGLVEGSYGLRSDLTQRPQGSPSCREQYLHGCYMDPVGR